MDTADLIFSAIVAPLLAEPSARAPIVGICGPQGSGKSTIAAALANRLAARGHRAAVVSLDDFYLPGSDREALARSIHPLLRTRGVPLTHDLALAARTLDALSNRRPIPLPRFDKARDEPAAPSAWPLQPPGTDIVVLEGWCVGARPQPPHDLGEPVNALEAAEDPRGDWRRAANEALAGPYQALFRHLRATVLLRAPAFDQVLHWRREQEDALRRERAAAGLPPARIMDEPTLRRFIQHFERITRHIDRDMPAHADLVIDLDAARSPVRTHTGGQGRWRNMCLRNLRSETPG